MPSIETVRRWFTLLMMASQFFNAAGLYYFTFVNLKLVFLNITTLDELTL